MGGCGGWLCRPLPVAFPSAADWATHRIPDQTEGERAVAFAALVFQPCRLRCILVQVARADVVVLADDLSLIHISEPTRPY